MNGIARTTFVVTGILALLGSVVASRGQAQQAVSMSVADTILTADDSVIANLAAKRSPPPNVVQSGDPHPEDSPMRGVVLDSAQQVGVDSVNAVYVPQLILSAKTLSTADKSSFATLFSAAEGLYTQYMAAIRAVLTPLQQATFDQNQAALKTRSLVLHADLDAWEKGQ